MCLLGRLLLVGVILGVITTAQGVGGLGEELEATAQVQQIIDEVKSQVLYELGLSEVPRYEALTYRKQIVAGINYFVKVAISENDKDDVVHVKVYKKLPAYGGETSLTSLQRSKSPSDPIMYF